jgi:hypothetical protein
MGSLDFRGFGSPCSHDDSDDSFRILGLGTKIMCLVRKIVAIDLHKIPGSIPEFSEAIW